jgi:hypothetical protein
LHHNERLVDAAAMQKILSQAHGLVIGTQGQCGRLTDIDAKAS